MDSAPPQVGTYRTNAGTADVHPGQAHLARLMRRSDAAFSAALRSSAPVFTGASGARALSRAARLGERGLPSSCVGGVADGTGAVGAERFYGASEASYERRTRRYVSSGSLSRNGPVFSGADTSAYTARLQRIADTS
jgi:hypothetical protein